ncbi:hypothetical protein EYC80_009205 [Monilinia laxa]|uniref:Major facilitator superfamily (MFS) profile domain-containing protein n=1 Tax=Monilinia laxa TaxID=61186 RepID=A0A5N6JXJ5_MONLA|nr:hypothetical protein EYC80_009205 [Monilinia laxa]
MNSSLFVQADGKLVEKAQHSSWTIVVAVYTRQSSADGLETKTTPQISSTNDCPPESANIQLKPETLVEKQQIAGPPVVPDGGVLAWVQCAAAFCTQYWHQILPQGLVMGIGLGSLFMPATAVIASYFTRRRGLAMGLASSGSTMGGILYPVIFSQLINKIHFGCTIRVVAFIMISLSILPVLGMKMRYKPPAVRRLFNAEAWKEPVFTLYAIALFVGYAGMYIPYFYVQEYCLEKKIITGSLNFYLLPIINGSGFFGRIFFGHLADTIGALNAFGATSGVCSILLLGWMGMNNEGSIIVFCVLYGFFSAGPITLAANVVANVLTPDMRQFGVRLTMQLVPSALGLLIGNPIAGAILQGGWLGLQDFAVATVTACTLLTIAARVPKMGWGVMIKI